MIAVFATNSPVEELEVLFMLAGKGHKGLMMRRRLMEERSKKRRKDQIREWRRIP